MDNLIIQPQMKSKMHSFCPLSGGEREGEFAYPLLASLFLPHACAFRHIAIVVLSELGVELETKL